MSEAAYRLAREAYAAWGVDTEKAMGVLGGVALSLHCWQGDDVGGFESGAGLTGGGIQATGNYPGKARSVEELRGDLGVALGLLPGRHRVNLHAIYGDYVGGKVPERDEVGVEHFSGWIEWAKERGVGLDFNPTFFSHPRAAEGFTLSSRDKGVREFWVRHGVACRKIGEGFGRAIGKQCVTNFWVPDGYKDMPADRAGPRARLEESLDAIFAVGVDGGMNVDALEGKLFGIGSESYVVGSHEFYLGYAVKNRKMLCLDAGHYHPTESVADKISAVLRHLEGILLHVSRGVRWDSDHVVVMSDELRGIAEEIVRGDYLGRVRIGLDYFDASINRVAAWVIGARAMLKALLVALLEPTEMLKGMEEAGDFTGRLAVMEEIKGLPWGTVWEMYCERAGVVGRGWLEEVRAYERGVLAKR